MHRLLILLLAMMAFAASSLGQGPAAILAQLGVRGVTAAGGDSNYAGFLVKLDASGHIAEAMLPSLSSNLNVAPLVGIRFISTNGVDIATAGSIVTPFRTLGFAITNIPGNVVFVLAPGTHPRASVAIANPAITHLAFVGLDPDTTFIDGAGSYSLAFQNSQPAIVDITGLTVDRVEQRNNVTIAVNAWDRGRLNSLTCTYSSTNSFATLTSDPSSSLPAVSAFGTNLLSHDASMLRFVPAVSNNWTAMPSTVAAALNTLAANPRFSTGSSTGAVFFWNGTNLVEMVGASNQVMFGGVVPGFRDLQIGGSVTGVYSNVTLTVNSVGTSNVVDNSITLAKLEPGVRSNLVAATNGALPLVGDVTGSMGSNTVVAIRGIPISAPGTNNGAFIVYNMASNRFEYASPSSSSSNWALYKAVSILDMNNLGITNIGSLTLNGVTISTWPGASTWYVYPSMGPVDINGFGIINAASLQLGGVTKTAWPDVVASIPTNWSVYPARASVDMSNNTITNVAAMTLGGQYRTNWPAATGGDAWSGYPATQQVNVAGQNITNVAGIYFGGEYHTNWPGNEAVTNWSKYKAIQNIDINGKVLNNVGGMSLDGTTRTTWPADGALWYTYSAAGDADMDSHGIDNVSYMRLNGVLRSSWPLSAESWYTVSAGSNLNMANHAILGVRSITLGGTTRTNWPDATSAERWSDFPATNDVIMSGRAISNVVSITLTSASSNGWRIAEVGGELAFTFNGSPAFSLTQAGTVKIPSNAAAGYVLKTDGTSGTWQPLAWAKEAAVTNLNMNNFDITAIRTLMCSTATVTTLILPDGAADNNVLVSDALGKAHWAPYAPVAITNEADPYYHAGITNYYTKAQTDGKYIQTESDPIFMLLITNYYTMTDTRLLFSDINHNHDWMYSGLFHDHDAWYAQKNHLHTGVYSPTNHNHLGMYIPANVTNGYGTPQYGYSLYYRNSTSTYWGVAGGGGGSTNTGGTNRYENLYVGPSDNMPKPPGFSIFNATNAKVNLGTFYVDPATIKTVTNFAALGESFNTTNPAVTPQYATVLDYLYGNIAGNGGIRVKNFGLTVPTFAYITQISVDIYGRKAGAVPSFTVRLNNNGYISQTNSVLMTGIADATYSISGSVLPSGNAGTNIWGLKSIDGRNYLSGFDVDQPDFGVEMFVPGAAGGGTSLLIDAVRIRVTYVEDTTSFDLGVSTNRTFNISSGNNVPVLSATPTRLQVPYGPYTNWVLTCVDANGTAQWLPPTTSTNATAPAGTLLCGMATSTNLTNTVTFSVAYTSTPYVVASWADPNVDELAHMEVVSRTPTNFKWRIRNGAGVYSTNWIISWMACDKAMFSTDASALWSRMPAVQDVNMNTYSLLHVGSLSIGTNPPITSWPATRTASFVSKYPETGDAFMFWRAPYNVTIDNVGAVVSSGTNVTGKLQYYPTGSMGDTPVDITAGMTITTNGISTDVGSAVSAGAWLGWQTTGRSGEINWLSVTVNYHVP